MNSKKIDRQGALNEDREPFTDTRISINELVNSVIQASKYDYSITDIKRVLDNWKKRNRINTINPQLLTINIVLSPWRDLHDSQDVN